MTRYAQEFLKSVRCLDDDVNKSPIFITLKALYEALHSHGLNLVDAGRLAGSVKIDVNDSFVTDKELFNEVIATFAKFLYKLYVEITAINTTLFWTFVTTNELSLKYTY